VVPEMEVRGLKLENKMLCIDNADLAFTLEETARFFQKKGRNWLTEEHVEQIHEITEGWAGGIVLVSEVVRKKTDLSWLSELIRGDPSAGAILETLEKRNLFVHRVLERKKGVTFRMNRLFRDFLQRELETRQTGVQIRTFLHEAGETLARIGEKEKSIPFFIRAGSWKEAGDSVARIGTDFFITGRIRELGEWIEAMPEMVVWRNPWLIFYLTMTRRIKGGSRNVEDLQIALDLFRKQEDARGILLCTAYIIEAVVFLKESPDRINSWIEQGKAVLESVSRSPTFTWARAVLWQQIGFGYIAGNGEVPKGISACRNAFILGSKIRNAEIQLNASIVILLGHVYTGNYQEAEARLEEMKNLAHDGMHPEYRTLKNLVRIDLALKKGEFDTAEYYLDMSQNDIEKFGMIFLYPGFVEAGTLHRVYTGRIREALELADHLSDFSVLDGKSGSRSRQCRGSV
jgi:ATP/maltotriose-dependent transcriptional regulator MalT